MTIAPKAMDPKNPYFLYVEPDDTVNPKYYFLTGFLPENSIVQPAMEFGTSLGYQLIRRVAVNPPMVEMNIDFVRVEKSKIEHDGFNLLGSNGSSIGTVNTSTFNGSKTFLPNLGPGNVALTWNSVISSNNQFTAAHTDVHGQLVASPFLSARSGTDATFQQGGEAGIRVSSIAAATVNYRPFGMTLKVVPTVLANQDIKCAVMFDIAEPTNLNGEVVQFSDTSTSNIVILKRGESMILSGVSSDQLDKSRVGVPYLRRIPVLSFFLLRPFQI